MEEWELTVFFSPLFLVVLFFVTSSFIHFSFFFTGTRGMPGKNGIELTFTLEGSPEELYFKNWLKGIFFCLVSQDVL